MALRLNGSTSGYVEIDAPAVAGSNTLVLPNGNGTNGQYLQTNGSGGLSWATVSAASWTDGTSTSASGSSAVTFTGIPSTAKQIILTVNALSADGSNGEQLIKLGSSSGLVSSGYVCVGAYYGASTSGFNYTTDFRFRGTGAGSYVFYGQTIITKHSGNIWSVAGWIVDSAAGITFGTFGNLDVGATLDRVSHGLTTGNFDGGTVNVHYISQ